MTDEYAHISNQRAKGDIELNFYIFMAIFWPSLLVTGLIAYFVFPDYELRLATFVLSAIAGLVGLRVHRSHQRKNSATR
jgi:hypothetical protein